MRALVGFAAMVMAALPLAAHAAPLDPVATRAAVDRVLERDYPALETLYKDIHQHPELGFTEVATAARLAAAMRAAGFAVTEHVAKTGVVALYRNGPGPMVLVRTEMDALPLEEKTGLAWASRFQQDWYGKPTFTAHACGHDTHMAAWVGTARALVALKERWRGTLMFIAQPAEEAGGGAQAMLDDGLFRRFGKPDLGFALHVFPGPAGQVGWRAGPTMSNADFFEIVFRGAGTHGSMPHLGIDPIVIGAHFVTDLQSVVSRERDPFEFGVLTVGAFQAGSAGNIIPDSATLRGTVRSYDDGVRQKLLAGLTRTAQAAAAMAGAPAPEIRVLNGGHAVINDAALAARTGAVFKAAFGAEAQELARPGTASEDFSDFINAGVPSLYFSVGGTDAQTLAAARAAGKSPPANHSPLFAPEAGPTIRRGVEAMALAVIAALPPAP